MEKKEKGFRLLIVTGMSGSGKTQVSRFLEDFGYFCIDNLPPVLIPKFAELCAHSADKFDKVALVVDTRSREFFAQMSEVLASLKQDGILFDLLFMEASDEVIIRRYKETRRRHPLAPSSRISEGIKKEREQLAPLSKLATHLIDTTDLSQASLKAKLTSLFGNGEGDSMSVNVLSFGFKYGVPLDADLVFDVRFLPNPFYLPELKHKSGTVAEVADFIGNRPVTNEFKKRLDDMIGFLVPQYQKEGKSQLVIAVGCTGGMHRSVYIAKHIFDFLTARGNKVMLEHRDLMKNDVREHETGK